MLASFVAPGTLLAQASAGWVSVWLTPMWVFSLGLLLGGVLLLAVLAGLLLLSLTPLGRLADSPRAGRTAAVAVGSVIAVLLTVIYVPQAADHGQMLILPLFLLGLTLGFAIVYGMWHRTREELPTIAREGVMPYLLGTAAAFAVVGLAATPVVESPQQIIGSIWQVPLLTDGTQSLRLTLEPASADLASPDDAPFQHVPMDYVMANVAELTLQTDRTIIIADAEQPADFQRAPRRINAGETVRYERTGLEQPPLPHNPASVYIQNREVDPATVTITLTSRPTIPQAASIVGVGLGFFLFLISYLTIRQAAPRISAVALATAKSEMAQPLYLLLLALGLFGVALFTILPFNTLGDDIRMMKDSGVTLIMVLGMLQAVWSAGTSVSDEIEGRTALTVLSKPISRGSFLLGKYLGIMLTVLVLFAVITAFFYLVLSYKPIYDARENSEEMPGWVVGHEELVSTIPALILYFMQTMAIGGIAVALATRLPLISNFVVCFVIYVIGNLTAPIVRSTVGENELVGFVGKLIAVIVPNLNAFNVQSAVDSGNAIPLIYLAGAFNYLFFFSVMILMVALLMFEDRDLA